MTISIIVTEQFGAEAKYEMHVDAISIDENGSIQFLKYSGITSLHPDQVITTFSPNSWREMKIVKN